MTTMLISSVIRLRSDESGQGLVEYLLILALVGLSAAALSQRLPQYWAPTLPRPQHLKHFCFSLAAGRRGEPGARISQRPDGPSPTDSVALHV